MSGSDFLYLRKGEHTSAPIIAPLYALIKGIDWCLVDQYVLTNRERLAKKVGNPVPAIHWGLVFEYITANWQDLMRTGMGLTVETITLIILLRNKADYKKLEERLLEERSKGKQLKAPKDFKVICTPTPLNMEVLPVFKIFDAEIRHHKTIEKKGQHCFYLNDKRFYFFLRAEKGGFFGFTGDDPHMRKQLKIQFETEWASIGKSA